MTWFEAAFADLPDPRKGNAKRHDLLEVLTIQGHVIAGHETLDLPPIRPIVTRHQRLACTCGACGHRTKAAPLAQGSPFGPNIQALALYMKHLQHVSYQRLERLFSDIFGLKISQGGLGNLLRRSKPALDAEKAAILQQVRQAEAVASDETGVRIEGVNAQHWVFRTPNAVLHETAFSRGAQVVRDVMDGGTVRRSGPRIATAPSKVMASATRPVWRTSPAISPTL